MRQKLTGIVLRVVKWNERHKIINIYTAQNGLMGFLVPDSSTKSSRARNSMLMPLSVVEFEANIRPGSDLATLHDLQRRIPLIDIYSNPVKNAIVLFVSELLCHCIQEHEQNTALFKFIEESIVRLEDSRDSVANFHLCFLYHLGKYLGIVPNVQTYRDGYWFDMQEGVFVASRREGHSCLPPEEAKVLHNLSRISFQNMHLFHFNREQRNEVLALVLSYYRIHNSTIGSLNSPEVLSQLFV